MISELTFIWNLFPEAVQDKIKEVSVNKATDFLVSTFSDAASLNLIFWKSFEKIALELYVDKENSIIKYRLEKGLGHPDIKTAILNMNTDEPLTEISNSFENELYWGKIVREAVDTLQTTEWRLEVQEKIMLNALLISQYIAFKNTLISFLSEKAENSAKVLLKTTLETHYKIEKLHSAVADLAQKMIGQIQQVNIQGNNNLVLIDVKGKEIVISLQGFLENYNAIFQQVLYLLQDKSEPAYLLVKQKIEEKIVERRSELDEFYLYTEIKELNQYAESSRAIIGKTVSDLDTKALNKLFKTEQTKNHFLKHQINRNASIETKLKELYLMSNGYVIKGTYLCLCAASEMRTINTTADYTSLGVYESQDRTQIKIAEELYGNLVYQFEQVENSLLLALGSLQIIDLLKRISDYSIPKFVVRELIANAIVHRDYSENANIHTTVELYSDRLVVRNAGKFPDHINPDDLENIQSKAINKEIARIFFLHGIVQKKGSGIQRVQEKLKERKMKAAVFEQRNGIVSVTVYKANEIEQQEALAVTYNNHAASYNSLGKHREALDYNLKALEIREKILSVEHPDLATSYNNLAITYYHLRNWEKAVSYAQKALSILLKILPPNHPYISQLVQTQLDILVEAIIVEGREKYQVNINWLIENVKPHLDITFPFSHP